MGRCSLRVGSPSIRLLLIITSFQSQRARKGDDYQHIVLSLFIHLYGYICMHVYTCKNVYIFEHVYMDRCIFLCIYVYISMYVCTCVYVFVQVWVYVCVCACVSACKYIFLKTYSNFNWCLNEYMWSQYLNILKCYISNRLIYW